VESLPIKRRILKKEEKEWEEKKKRSEDWKAKEVKPHMKKLHISKGEKKKKEDEIYNDVWIWIRPHFCPKHQLNPPYKYPQLLPAKSVKKVWV
jgi:hypothetical protein